MSKEERTKHIWTGDRLLLVTDMSDWEESILFKIRVSEKQENPLFLYFELAKFKGSKQFIPNGWTDEQGIDEICEELGITKKDFTEVPISKLVELGE